MTGKISEDPDVTLPLAGTEVQPFVQDGINKKGTSAAHAGPLAAVFESLSHKGAANGYAGLDSGGKVPSAQLPAFVDDVLEYANSAAFPVTGATGIIYVALDTNKTWRWSGSAYIEISPSPGSTDSVTEGSSNLYFTAARVLAVVLTGLSTATNAAITAADTVLSALGKLQKQITDHKADTANPHAVTQTQVGLSAVNNTSDANKPVSTAQQTALDLKAPLNSPTFTGTPAGPTASPGSNSTQFSTTAFVKAAVDVVLGGVSSALDTLSEIATALGLKPNYSETTWTPDLKFGGANVGMTYSARVGRAQRVGTRAKLKVDIVLSAKGSSTGAVTITGMPAGHTPVSDGSGSTVIAPSVIWYVQNMTFTGAAMALALQSNTSLFAYVTNNGTSTAMTDAAFQNTTQMSFVIEYETAAAP